MVLMLIGRKEGGELLTLGAGSKNCSPETCVRKANLKIKRKMVTKRVAVRAVNIPIIRIDIEFRGGANRDSPEVERGHIWTLFCK